MSLIKRNREVLLYTEVTFISGSWNRGIPRYTEMSCPHFRGLGCSVYRAVLDHLGVGI